MCIERSVALTQKKREEGQGGKREDRGKKGGGGRRREGREGREEEGGKGRGRKNGLFYITIWVHSVSQMVCFANCHDSLLKPWKHHNTSIALLYKSVTPFSSQRYIYSQWGHNSTVYCPPRNTS